MGTRNHRRALLAGDTFAFVGSLTLLLPRQANHVLP